MLAGAELTGELRQDQRALSVRRERERRSDGLSVHRKNDSARSLRPGVSGIIGHDGAQRENRGLRRTEAAALVRLDDPLQTLLDLGSIRRITHPGQNRKSRGLN